MSRILITGVTGQVGSYQADLQLGAGHEVWGIARRISSPNLTNISAHTDNPNFHLITCDLTDPSGLNKIFSDVQPDSCYHYAAQSFVKSSFDNPNSTMEINVMGTLNLLESIRYFSPQTKFFFAASSEMYGSEQGKKHQWGTLGEINRQDEKTPFMPNSPYATSKLAGFHLVKNYRESYNIFALSGITFNTESPRRGKEFVTRKITDYLGRFKNGKTSEKLKLGNLSAKRDWGYALDSARAAEMLLKLDAPQDCVIATGETWSIQQFVDLAFEIAGLPKDLIEIATEFFRPNEVPYLCGNYNLLHKLTGWTPSISFPELVKLMVESDIKLNG